MRWSRRTGTDGFGRALSFNTPTFVVFFLLFSLVHAGAVALGSRSIRLALIIASSAIFYAAWDVRFLPLLFLSITIDFFLAQAIGRTENHALKKRYLWTSVGMNLGILAIFKYLDFGLANAGWLLTTLGLDVSTPVLNLVLPVGISFYTFQSLSYTIDVYRGHDRPTDSFAAFAASVSFFPQLVAGPIVRANHLVPQMLDGPRLTWGSAQLGVLLMGLGAFKKTVADLLGPIADRAFADPTGGWDQAWLGALAFTGQIYGDFSGYTDIAIGLAAVLGYRFLPNFDLPYVAVSPSDFWRRWHISLSTWLRDYLYIPLGGNRHALYRNLMVTMLLGGLWHGANWTFVIWGLYHGLLLVGQRALAGLKLPSWSALAFVRVAGMFYLTVIGWVFFRAETVGQAFDMLWQMHTFEGSAGGRTALFGWVVAAIVGPHLLDALVIRRREDLHPMFIWTVAYVCLVFALVFSGSNYDFIYFQF